MSDKTRQSEGRQVQFSSLILLSVLMFGFPSHASQMPASTEEIRPQPPSGSIEILVEPKIHRLTLYMDGVPIKRYPIALGKPRTPTPAGEFVVINKYKNWGSGFGTRWIGLNVPWGIYGIHGTNKPHSIGGDASHGCIRMLNRHVEELYEYVRPGAKVVILGHALGKLHEEPRRLAQGDAGGDVQLIQTRLKNLGFFQGPCHGKFGPQTDSALRAFEKSVGLPPDGVAGMREYLELGLLE
jgi:hypothetical protein